MYRVGAARARADHIMVGHLFDRPSTTAARAVAKPVNTLTIIKECYA